jgi:hypothetical protein
LAAAKFQIFFMKNPGTRVLRGHQTFNINIEKTENHEKTTYLLLPYMPPGYQPGASSGEVRALRIGKRSDFPLARPFLASARSIQSRRERGSPFLKPGR